MRGSRAGSSIRSSSSSAAIRARSAEPRSTVVSGRPGDLGERRVVHPDERDVARHVEACIAQRRERADRQQVVGAEDRVGPRAREQALGRTAAGLDHEVGGDLDQRVVARERARAEAVEIAEAPRGARRRVLAGR